jgi:hypothetical protein
MDPETLEKYIKILEAAGSPIYQSAMQKALLDANILYYTGISIMVVGLTMVLLSLFRRYQWIVIVSRRTRPTDSIMGEHFGFIGLFILLLGGVFFGTAIYNLNCIRYIVFQLLFSMIK